jgi:tetratricopeptide (TPR) repeat protein
MFANAKRWASAAKYYGELWTKEQSPAVAVRYVPALMMLPTPDIATAQSVLASKAVDVEGNYIFRMQRAWVAMRDNRPRDAEADMVSSWKMMKIDDPDMIGAYFREMARVYSRPGSETRYADAVKFARERLFAEGKTDVAEFRLSQLMASDKAQEDAAFKEMERLAGAATTPWVISNAARLVGNTYYAQKNYEKALALFKRGLEATPDDAELLNNAGYTLSRHLNKPEEGLPLISKAAELAPGNTSVLDSKGTVQMHLKQYDDAEKTLMEALRAARTQFDQAAPILHLAEVKLEKGDRSAADDLFRRLRTLIDSEAAPKRIEQAYREEIDRVQRRLQGGS